MYEIISRNDRNRDYLKNLWLVNQAKFIFSKNHFFAKLKTIKLTLVMISFVPAPIFYGQAPANLQLYPTRRQSRIQKAFQ